MQESRRISDEVLIVSNIEFKACRVDAWWIQNWTKLIKREEEAGGEEEIVVYRNEQNFFEIFPG